MENNKLNEKAFEAGYDAGEINAKLAILSNIRVATKASVEGWAELMQENKDDGDTVIDFILGSMVGFVNHLGEAGKTLKKLSDIKTIDDMTPEDAADVLGDMLGTLLSDLLEDEG